jgi:phosphoserine phosphatase
VRPSRAAARAAAIAALAVLLLASAARQHGDPLPSWNDTDVKRTIVAFVQRVTRAGSPDFVPSAERIATFDNDGTLWVEKPLPAEIYFVLSRVRELAARDPSLKTRQPFKAALEGDTAYFHEAGAKAVVELLVASHTGMSQEAFNREAEAFFRTAKHPTLRRPFTSVTYAPMQELLSYLRANDFEIWICSGGTADFMRAFAPRIYGIPAQQIIGSDVKKDSRFVDGRRVVWRLPELGVLNDKDAKPVGLDRSIGRRPVIAAGNVGGAGDVAMLEYSRGREGPSLQLLINHDDSGREFAYAERGQESLDAARDRGFTVVSMKADWKDVLAALP